MSGYAWEDEAQDPSAEWWQQEPKINFAFVKRGVVARFTVEAGCTSTSGSADNKTGNPLILIRGK